MALTLSPIELDVRKALQSFLMSILSLPADDVILGQVNRVPEPRGANFVVFTPMRQERIETNIDAAGDAAFTASIAGAIMTVSAVQIGEIAVGAQVFGTGLASGATTVTGTAGPGLYTVSPPQVAASQPMAAGQATFLQPVKLTIQIDVHGPDSADNAQVISTMFRDPYAVEQFALLGDDVVPLYADDPRQAPFINENQQYEYRWVVEACLQANQTVSGVPQQFAGVVDVGLVEVEAAFPPS